jgi:uroporphyrinogen-III synthase
MRQNNVLLTRSIEENAMVIDRVREMGFGVMHAPMISYTKFPCDFSQFFKIHNIIITSKFAAKIVSESYLYNVNAWVVGEESANILSANPKIKVQYIADNVMDLMDHYIHDGHHLSKIIYFSGDNITQDIPFATRHILYSSSYAAVLSEDSVYAIKSDNVDVIMLYSQKSALNLLELMERYNLLQNIQNSVVIAISKDVGKAFESYVQDVLIPDNPSSIEMLQVLKRYEKRS